MDPFATGQIFSRVNWSDHNQQEKLGRFPQQNVSASGVSAGDDHTRFTNIVLPHLDDAYTLAGHVVHVEASLGDDRSFFSFTDGSA